MSFSVISINVSEVFNNGGWELIITGVFEQGHSYKVYIGDYKTSADAVCYSGVLDQGNIIYPELNNTLYSYTPLLNVTDSNPYSVTIIDIGTLESHTLVDCLYVRNKQYNSKVYFYKKCLIPNYKLGSFEVSEES